MKVLICAATPIEMFSGTIPGIEIKQLITGIGISQCSFNLGRYLPQEKIDLYLQIGIAGTFNQDLDIGKVVIVSKDCFADFGVEDHDHFIHISEALALDQSNPFNQLWIEPKNELAKKCSLPSVVGITVNTTHGDEGSIGRVMTRYRPDVESMEGAAFFAACMISKLPCIQIRAISNVVEPRNKTNWNIPYAIHRLHTELTRILPLLLETI